MSDDPYATLQAEQRKCEMQWKSQRVAKRSKAEEPAVLQTSAIPSKTRPSEIICTVIEKVAEQSDQNDELKKQLEAKSQECSNLKRQLEISEKTREADAEALRKQTQVNEDIMKVSEAFASIKLTFGFDRMNSRLKQPSIELTRYLSRDNIEQESKIDT